EHPHHLPLLRRPARAGRRRQRQQPHLRQRRTTRARLPHLRPAALARPPRNGPLRPALQYDHGQVQRRRPRPHGPPHPLPGTRERHQGRLDTPLRGQRPRGPPAHPGHRRPARTRRGRCRMIYVRNLTTSLAVRDGGDGRTLVGALLPWNIPAQVVDRGRVVTETFTRGALDGTDPNRVPLTATHPQDAGTLPIGRTLTIEDRADAAWGEWLVSDTALGNEVLALARDGVPLGLSVGFMEVPGGSRWSADRQRGTPARA